MKKTLFLGLLAALTLTACSPYRNDIKKFDHQAYKNDIKLYENIEISPSSKEHLIKGYVTKQGNKIVYTVQIVYLVKRLEDIHAILVPEEMKNSSDILPCIGYSEHLSLGPVKDEDKGEYPGFNLSYATTTYGMAFDLFVSHLDTKRNASVYRVSSFVPLGE